MKVKIYAILVILLLWSPFIKPAFAHPGRTAADGCHYCRTNCSSWGVPQNERHCHDGGSTTGSTDSTSSTDTTGSTGSIETAANLIPATQAPKIVQATRIPTPLPTKTPTLTKSPYIETDMDKKKMFKVVAVVDGDTIKVNIRGKIESVRLLAIDTPETKDQRKPVQCFGVEATKKMQSLVGGKYVKLVDDRSQGNRDKYQRLLRYVYLENTTFVNREMVAQGYAFSYKQYPTKFLDAFNKLEKQAREKNLGM